MRPNKREIILKAAEKLFRERRIHELTMEDVAQAAGVGKGTIYNHFENKDDLLFQIATHGFEELCALVAATPKKDKFHARLAALCEQISEFFQQRRAVMRMIHEHEGRLGHLKETMKERWLENRRKLAGAVASILSQGVAEGAVRRDLPCDFLATLLLGMLGARDHDFSHAPGKRPPVEMLVGVFLEGAGVIGGMNGARVSGGENNFGETS
jgi:AcrR family transcriptional regulator